jgi:hypothetical protein
MALTVTRQGGICTTFLLGAVPRVLGRPRRASGRGRGRVVRQAGGGRRQRVAGPRAPGSGDGPRGARRVPSRASRACAVRGDGEVFAGEGWPGPVVTYVTSGTSDVGLIGVGLKNTGDRARPAAARHREGLAQRVDDEVGAVDAHGPLGHRAKTRSVATSWAAPRWALTVAPRPASTTTGRQPTYASAMPVSRFVAPGPAVTRQTPGSPVSCAWAW